MLKGKRDRKEKNTGAQGKKIDLELLKTTEDEIRGMRR